MDEIHKRFQTGLIEAASLTGLGEQIIDIAVGSLDSIDNMQVSPQVKKAISNQKEMLNRLYKSEALSYTLPIIFRQQVVLIVSILEAYLSDMVRYIGNDHRRIIIWPDGKEKRGSVDLSLLKSDATTIGDLIYGMIEQRGVSFQDLKSIKEFFLNYLELEIVLSQEIEEKIILGTATRHLVVHCGAKIDNKFLKQIRDTSRLSDFIEGEVLNVSEKDVREYMSAFQKLGDTVNILIKNSIHEKEMSRYSETKR